MKYHENRKEVGRWRWLITVLLAAALLPFVPMQRAMAADTTTVSIQVTYGQTEARKVLDKINEKRTAEGVATLAQYDYGLEKCAMQRAAEVALDNPTGMRPNGSTTDTVYREYISTGNGACKELVFCYEETAEQVVNGWCSQVNAYEVLLRGGNYFGAARVRYNQAYYWVLIYSDLGTEVNVSGAYDGTQTREISILSNRIRDAKIDNCPTGTIYLNVGDYYDLSKCSASIRAEGHELNERCPLVGTVSATVGSTQIATFNGTSLYAAATGKTTVSLSCGGLAAAPFEVVVQQPSLSNAVIDTIPNQTYTGYAIYPTVKVRVGNTVLVQNTDYDITYQNNVNKGQAVVVVTGKGKYTGTVSTTFWIVAPSLSNATVVTIADQAYTGGYICPSVTVLLNNALLYEGTDYTLSYTNNINMGIATITIIGIGNYSGQTRTVTFRITGTNLSAATIAAIPDQLYTGSDIRPTLTVTANNVTLTQNTDYYVSYSNNRNVGTATVTVTGRGNYSGTKSATFRIIGREIGNTTVSSIDTQRYTGDEICPSVTVKIGSVVLQKNVDYTLTYRDNRQPGTASITINGAGSYSGSKVVTFKIAQATLSSATVKVSDQTYTGKAKTPHVTVKLNGETLTEDDDYEVEYRNNKKPGKATVVINGVGAYSGTKKGYFVIVPKKMVWVSAKATANAKGKAAFLSWKKDSNASGYELYCSKKKTSGYSRIGTITKNSSTKCTHDKRPAGTYYYKIRSYILVDGKKCYGAFSKVKRVTIKNYVLTAAPESDNI